MIGHSFLAGGVAPIPGEVHSKHRGAQNVDPTGLKGMSLFGDSVFAGAPGPSADAVIRAANAGFEKGFREIAAVRRRHPGDDAAGVFSILDTAQNDAAAADPGEDEITGLAGQPPFALAFAGQLGGVDAFEPDTGFDDLAQPDARPDEDRVTVDHRQNPCRHRPGDHVPASGGGEEKHGLQDRECEDRARTKKHAAGSHVHTRYSSIIGYIIYFIVVETENQAGVPPERSRPLFVAWVGCRGMINQITQKWNKNRTY